MGDVLKLILNTYNALNIMKLTWMNEMYDSMFSIKYGINNRVQDQAKVFWYIMVYAWKRQKKYFQLCFIVCFDYTKFKCT